MPFSSLACRRTYNAALPSSSSYGSSMPWRTSIGCFCFVASLLESQNDINQGTKDMIEETPKRQPTNEGFFRNKSWVFNSIPLSTWRPLCALCDSVNPETTVTTNSSDPKFRPLEGDIDAVVDEILRDPSINLTLIPDSIERRLYKSTIQLTLSLVYDTIASIHGTELFSHEIHLRRLLQPPFMDQTNQQRRPLYDDRNKINDRVLEEVAERLLSNRAINSSLIPDNIEKQLYVNCIKIIFRTLNAVFDGFSLQVCGHEFRISLQAAQMEQAIVKASLSVVDLDLLRQYARDHGVQDVEQSFWDSLFLRKEFTAQLHAALYGLVLGIIDDILANTKIQLLGDTMELDIVPMSEQKLKNTSASENTFAVLSDKPSQVVQPQSLALPIFAAGVGVGAAIVTITTILTGGGAR